MNKNVWHGQKQKGYQLPWQYSSATPWEKPTGKPKAPEQERILRCDKEEVKMESRDYLDVDLSCPKRAGLEYMTGQRPKFHSILLFPF